MELVRSRSCARCRRPQTRPRLGLAALLLCIAPGPPPGLTLPHSFRSTPAETGGQRGSYAAQLRSRGGRASQRSPYLLLLRSSSSTLRLGGVPARGQGAATPEAGEGGGRRVLEPRRRREATGSTPVLSAIMYTRASSFLLRLASLCVARRGFTFCPGWRRPCVAVGAFLSLWPASPCASLGQGSLLAPPRLMRVRG